LGQANEGAGANLSIQTTRGWLDALANFLSTESTLGFVKGTNLFAENFIDDPGVITDQFVIYDEGHDQMTQYRHLHLNWNVRFVTSRKKRLDAQAALNPVYDLLISKKRFTATSDQSESFTIINVRSAAAPDVVEKTDSGRYASSCTLQFELIPD